MANPVVLVGFCLFLLFGIHRVLLKTGLFAQLSQTQSSATVRLILKYGFWVAILVVVLGFAFAGFQVYNDGQRDPIKQQAGPSESKGPAIRVGKIEQKVSNGTAVAAVQGDVTVNKPARQTEPKPKP